MNRDDPSSLYLLIYLVAWHWISYFIALDAKSLNHSENLLRSVTSALFLLGGFMACMGKVDYLLPGNRDRLQGSCLFSAISFKGWISLNCKFSERLSSLRKSLRNPSSQPRRVVCRTSGSLHDQISHLQDLTINCRVCIICLQLQNLCRKKAWNQN